MTPKPIPAHTLRATIAEEIAMSFIALTEPMALNDPAELKKRALLKIQMDSQARQVLTVFTSKVQTAAEQYKDSQINELLQPGMRTMTVGGNLVEVDLDREWRLHVTNMLDGMALEVSGGAFVIFIDNRCAGTEALRRWQQLVKDDTRLMVIPLNVPQGKSIRDVVAARPQDDPEGFIRA